LSLLVVSLILSGCVNERKATISQNPVEIKNTEVSDGYAHLYILNGQPISVGVNISLNSSTKTYLSKDTYGYFKLEPGKHWVDWSSVGGPSKSKCLDFRINSNNYIGTNSFATFDPLAEIDSDSLIDKSQVFINYSMPIKSIPLRKTKTPKVAYSDGLKDFDAKLDEKLSSRKFDGTDELKINIKLLKKEEGNQAARWFWGDSEKDKAYASVMAEYFLNNQKIDEYVVYRELTGGIFGGSIYSLYDDMANQISSYTTCAFGSN
jgi:hypothetical protein